ncbi:MAG TPA: tail fiber protein [Candidatus Elarobacter sp.]|jgi:microcystin-dependent protein
MSNPFLSEIRIFSFSFAPRGWALCNGQILPINQNQPLFALLGTTYGGNGQTTFALPNLQGRVAMHMGQGHTLGERGGEETHTVVSSEMPAHIHPASADVKPGDGDAFIPTNTLPANAAPTQIYSAGSTNMAAMAPQMVSNVGGSQPHENRQPYLALNCCIALQGIFPSRN